MHCVRNVVTIVAEAPVIDPNPAAIAAISVESTVLSAAAENDSRFVFRRFKLLCADVLHLRAS